MIFLSNKILLFVVTFFLISGCVTDIPANPTIYQENQKSVNITPENKILLHNNISEFDLEFTLESFTGIYIRSNNNKNPSRDISEKQYAVYNLSIKNNGSNVYKFTLDKIILMSKKGLSIPTSINNVQIYHFEDINEARLDDISLLPGRTIRGYVAFDVDSMYDTSFSLEYDSRPIILTLFENSVLDLEKADLFNYSIAMGKQPYRVGDLESPDTYYPPEPEFYTDRRIAYSQIWSNWVNRSVVKFFKELDAKELNNIKRADDLPSIYSTYVLKVIPIKNFSIHHGRPVVIIDENNEELINGYYKEMVIYDNKTFRPLYDNFTISNATLVRMSFYDVYGWAMATRFSYNDQVVALDENRNIIFVGFDSRQMVS